MIAQPEYCYLQVVLDTRRDPPRIRRVFPSSDRTPTSMDYEEHLILHTISASSFHLADQQMRDWVLYYASTSKGRWIGKYLDLSGLRLPRGS